MKRIGLLLVVLAFAFSTMFGEPTKPVVKAETKKVEAVAKEVKTTTPVATKEVKCKDPLHKETCVTAKQHKHHKAKLKKHKKTDHIKPVKVDSVKPVK